MAHSPELETDAETIAFVTASLHRMGLLSAGQKAHLLPLAGGVSSDIWKVDLPDGPVCVKRALPKLRVRQDWHAPVSRNASEVAWFETAGGIAPEAVPRILGQDPAAGLFAMDYLDPARHPVWKAQLHRGIAERRIAAQVGEHLARIHAATAGDPAVAARFATDGTFHDIRLEPYLETAASAHPDLAEGLHGLVHVTATNKRALVHGDVSPKNILVGPHGPIFLDAECAWYGDPAFDLAFCLNHLLLKCLWTPAAAARFLDCFGALQAAYAAGVRWEPPMAMERRTARLLAGLFLARIDGKSPVEYIIDESDKDRVRRAARAWLAAPPDHLDEIRAAWAKELGL